MTKQTESWEEEFDEKFEGYWRGWSIPDEIKTFIHKTRQVAILQVINDIPEFAGHATNVKKLKEQLKDKYLPPSH